MSSARVDLANHLANYRWRAEDPLSAHNQHRFYAWCAICSGDVSLIADVAVRWQQGERQQPVVREVLSPFQIVARNMAYWRQQRGLTQAQLGKRLEELTGRPWSNVTVSAAERSVDGVRVREFNVAEVAALAEALDVPVMALVAGVEGAPDTPAARTA